MSPHKSGERNFRSRRGPLLVAVAVVIALILWFTLHHEAWSPVNVAMEVPAAERVVEHASDPGDAWSEMSFSSPPQTLPVETFAVDLQPLQYDTENAEALARASEYYAELSYRLGAVPGLHMVNDGALADFRVTISNLDSADAQGTLPTSEWAAKASVEILNGDLRPADPAGTVYVLGMVGDAWRGRAPDSVTTHGPLSGDCETPKIMPCSPAAIAERQVMALRKKVFPRDESLQLELEERVLNAALDMRERNMAISDLLSMKMELSDEMMRAVLVRINRTAVDIDRGNLLALLAGQQRQETIQPLIDLARYDQDSSLRIQAVRLLATDFPNNSSVRAALEQIASDPSSPALQTTAIEAIDGLPEN